MGDRLFMALFFMAVYARYFIPVVLAALAAAAWKLGPWHWSCFVLAFLALAIGVFRLLASRINVQ